MYSPVHAFAVFSFERGPWLANCVASIERFAPGAPIAVYDDGSVDPRTREVLETLGRRHRVVIADGGGAGAPHPPGAKVGGLYANMQRALDELPDGRTFTFMQDDGQLVRPVEPADHERVARWFDADARHAFLGHMFLRGYRRGRDADALRLAPDGDAYAYAPEFRNGRWGRHFAAILTSRTDRLRAAGFRFAADEKANDARAATLFAPRAVLRDPFAADVPSAPALRNRVRTLGTRLAERLEPPGFHPIVPMTPDEVARLRGRDPAVLPFAEDFLRTEPRAPSTPWRHAPLQGRRVLRHLHRLEIGSRRRRGNA